MKATATQIVAGQLSEFDLPTLLNTFSVCRQVIALEVLGPSGQVTGRVILKGGKVLAATAGLATGAQALRKLMSSSTQARFRVFNNGADLTGDVVPLGSVDELVAHPDVSSSSGQESRVRMMEGSLAEFDIATVMQAVCIGRQYTELDVIGPHQKPIGTICLKAGKVVSAKAGTIGGMAAIHHLLDTPKSYQFAVYRNPAELQEEEPLGSVSGVLMRALSNRKSPATAGAVHRPAVATRATLPTNGRTLVMRGNLLDDNEQPTAQRVALADPSRVRVMEGALSDFDVPSLLQVANLGRQQVLLEVLDGHRLVGAIWVKAGMVLRATAGRLDGTAAVQRLIESPSTFKFVMSRISGQLDNIMPLGSLESTLLRAATSSEIAANANLGSIETPSPSSPSIVAGTSPSRIAVLAGSLSDFDLGTLLETVGFMRQHAELELRNNNALLGSVHLRSNMVLRASAGALHGVAAVTWLLDAPKTAHFAVFRNPTELDDVEPIGSSHEVLRRALTHADAPPSRQRIVDAPATGNRTNEEPRAPAASPRGRSRAWLVAPVAIGVLGAAAFVFRNWSTDRESSADVISASPVSAGHASTAVAAPRSAPSAIVPALVAPARTTPLAQATPTPVESTAGLSAVVDRAPIPRARVAPNVSDVAAAQTMLKRLGYDPGPIDGIPGPRTAAAVRAFQKAEQLNVDGALNVETRAALAHSDGAP